ncbi:MAG: hypothetical protein ABEK01_00160 [Candidatus Nanohaloarchaea archaeon]
MTEEVEIDEAVDVLEGSVEDLEEFLDEKSLELGTLREILEAEKEMKDRKTARSLLERQIARKRIREDVRLAREEIREVHDAIEDLEDTENLEREDDGEELGPQKLAEIVGRTVEDLKEEVRNRELGLEQLERILDTEKKVKDRKTAKDFLREEITRLKLEKDLFRAEDDIDQVEEDLERIRSDSDEFVDENIPEEEETEEGEAKKEETVDENEGSEGRKKELIRGMDVEMSDKELEKLSVEEIESIKEEKNRREELIGKLADEGFEEDELREASTSDLEKLEDSLREQEAGEENTEEEEAEREDPGEDLSGPEVSEDSSGKEIEEGEVEELQEEAEEDLELLQGARRDADEDEDEDGGKLGFQERVEEFQEKIEKLVPRRGEEDEDSGVTEEEKMIKLLESYRELEEKKSAIKTAQVMKAYLEKELGVDREMTYKELADYMEGRDGRNFEVLSDFLMKVHREIYTQKMVPHDMEEIIDTSIDTIEEME